MSSTRGELGVGRGGGVGGQVINSKNRLQNNYFEIKLKLINK